MLKADTNKLRFYRYNRSDVDLQKYLIFQYNLSEFESILARWVNSLFYFLQFFTCNTLDPRPVTPCLFNLYGSIIFRLLPLEASIMEQYENIQNLTPNDTTRILSFYDQVKSYFVTYRELDLLSWERF